MAQTRGFENDVKWIDKNNFKNNLNPLIKAAGKTKKYYADGAILLYPVKDVFDNRELEFQ